MSIIEALQKAEAVREEAIKQARAELKPGLLEFMKDHPEVGAIRWTQYAPHFNDGDECIFSVHELQAKPVNVALKDKVEEDEDDEEDDEDGDFVDCYGSREQGFPSQTWKDLIALNRQLQSAEDVLKEAFGNHVRVTVTKTGVDVEEYEHD